MNIEFPIMTDNNTYKTVILTKEKVEAYFDSKGVPVNVRIHHDPVTSTTSIIARPRIAMKVNFTHELLSQGKSSEHIIKDMIDQAVEATRDITLKTLLLNKRLIPNSNIEDFSIVYNPNKVNPEMFIKLIVANEL